jgi:hypothetical protein
MRIGKGGGCGGPCAVEGWQDLRVECIVAAYERQSVNVCGLVK